MSKRTLATISVLFALFCVICKLKGPLWITLLGGISLPLIICHLLKSLFDNFNLPPGPKGWPLVGLLVELHKNNAILKCQECAQKFGKIFSMPVGNFDVVVISDYKVIHEAMKRDEFQGRPDFQVFGHRNSGIQNRGILFADGNTWQEQRRFALKTLRDFGFGKQSMESLLLHEAQELVIALKKKTGEPVKLKHTFNCSVFNSLWYMLSGQRFDMNDQEFQRILTLLAGHMDKQFLFSPAWFYPWPAKYNLVRRGLWKKALIMVNSIFDLMDGLIQTHLKEYDESKTNDFIDAYLHKHMKGAENSSFGGNEGIQNLRVTLVDLFQAGTETTSTTLVWAVLFMTKDPQVQEKLHEEVDRVIGTNRAPSREDRALMPYLEAFTNEVHRKATLVPMTVFHRATRDTKLAGYTIKRGTVVLPSVYAAHHDKDFWGDPEVFRPERFLDDSGTNVLQKEALIPFATGKRICLGETLARDTLFLFLTVLLQNFSFQLDPADESIDVSIPSPTFIGFPKEFKVILTSRIP